MKKEIENRFSPIFDKVEEVIKKDKPCIVAIDGMCGSGKTYLAKLLAKTYESNVFHMDDFFLPIEMRTEERLAQAGGNVHYERFKEEVLDTILENRTVIYRPYLCGRWEFGEERKLRPKKLNIIEGSYSMHPYLSYAYDLKIFLEIDINVQLERISHREGIEKLQDFVNKWIPLENKYFEELQIRKQCDIILDTRAKN